MFSSWTSMAGLLPGSRHQREMMSCHLALAEVDDVLAPASASRVGRDGLRRAEGTLSQSRTTILA